MGILVMKDPGNRAQDSIDESLLSTGLNAVTHGDPRLLRTSHVSSTGRHGQI